jgi:hypothetical protein
MKITWSNAAYAMNLCAKSIAALVFNSKVVVSILLTSNLRNAALSRTYVNVLGASGTLSARSLKGFNSRLKGVARELAVAIGILLSIAMPLDAQASIVPLKALADKQLTDKQYQCHNEIVYRESRWKIDAVNGSHHGYYQMRSKSMQNKPYDYQFYIYWYYVSKRYGLDYEIPDYCKALHHLKTKGWQ